MQDIGAGIGKLGFGLMRLPKKEGAFDLPLIERMVDRFLEAGYTYFDTAWAYDGSEEITKKALVERHPRSAYQLATKLSAWIDCKTREDAIRQFEVSLERTGAGYFDFYLLHNLGETRTAPFDAFDLWNFAQEKKAEGLIRHVGFSAHATAEELDAILAAHPEMEFVQLQINYADWEDPAIQAGKCYEAARKHGTPIVIMEPVKGGMLATPPDSVEAIFRAADPAASPARWAIRFAAGLPGVITVLSGMNSLEQLEDNIAAVSGFSSLSDSERGTIERAQQALKSIPLIPCTSCEYCAKVCPAEIGISGTFAAMNCLTLYGNLASARGREGWLVDSHARKRAEECVQCGACEAACPQRIAIREELKRAAKALHG